MMERPQKRQVAAATRTLARLNEQADAVRAELARMLTSLADVRRDLSGKRGADLREANEQLVLAALQAETIAETAVNNLGDLARSSQRDALTDTPNRALMLDRMEIAIAMARRHQTHAALLFLDLDFFKRINDSMGHTVGDEVLQLVARRLESVVRDSDTVSRYSGDEFLVLLVDMVHESDAALIAAKILAALSAPSIIGGHVVRLSASIGISIYPNDGEDTATLINRADNAMYRAKRSGRGTFEFYTENLAADGEHLHLIGEAATEPAQHDEMTLPERELRLHHLREANEQLVLSALTAQDLEAQAEEAHHRQIKFLAMVAHELRDPLNPIRTAAELLEHARADEEMLARLKVVIERQVAHMTRLVDDLLDGSRVSTGKFRIERSVVELTGLLNQAVETSRPAIASRHQNLVVQIPPNPFSVEGDPIRLAQVFRNLLDNASKYSRAGGEIGLTVVILDKTTVVTVSDNGIGISPESLPHVFDLFVQGPRARAFHGGGLGIGLAVVRELVEAHGGTVVGRSAGMDLGSEFVVTLPIVGELPPG